MPGLDREKDPLPGDCGYLVAMAAPASPGCWRRFADPFITGLEKQGGTVLADAGPEAVERLESLMPGSHFIVAKFSSEQASKDAWTALAPDLDEQTKACDPVTIVALAGLKDDHPLRLTEAIYAS